MKDKSQNMELFTNQGCLTISAIKGIHIGNLSDKQLDEVNNHLNSCKLCQEAAEGVKNFNDIRDFEAGITELHNKWKSKSEEPDFYNRNKRIKVLSVAATIAVLIGISLFYLLNEKKSKEYFTDLLEQGMTLDSAMTQVQIHPVGSKKNYQFGIDLDTKSRNIFVSDSINTESAIPLGKIDITSVYANASNLHEAIDEVSADRKQVSLISRLSYPKVVMHMPPTYIDLNMPEEEVMDDLFVAVEEMPEFKGSDLQSFRAYIQKRIVYPKEAIEQQISGRVYAQFTIDESGELRDAKILYKVHPVLDKEVIRVLNTSPKWKPGKQRDKAVSVSMIVPVDFNLY